MISEVMAHISHQAHVFVYTRYPDESPYMNIDFPTFVISLRLPGHAGVFAQALMSPTGEAAEWAAAPGWRVMLVTPGTVLVDCAGVHMTMTPEQAEELGKEIMRHI